MYLGLDAFDFEVVTVGTVPATLDQAKYSPSGSPSARGIFMTMGSGTISYKFEGGTPTATEGHFFKLDDDPRYILGIPNLRNFKAVRADGSDGALMVTYLR